jgi:hypothetical protein
VKNPAFSKYFGGLVDKDEVNLERRMKTSRTKKLLETRYNTTNKGLQPLTQDKPLALPPEALELLLYPRFCVRHKLKDEEVVKEKFEQEAIKSFKILKPFNDFLLEIF